MLGTRHAGTGQVHPLAQSVPLVHHPSKVEVGHRERCLGPDRALCQCVTRILSVALTDAIPVNCNVTKRPHPLALRPFVPELDAFVRHTHFNILHPILRLIALSLELPEEALVEKHTLEGQSEVTRMCILVPYSLPDSAYHSSIHEIVRHYISIHSI